jgi:Zn-dependent metalloprotease
MACTCHIIPEDVLRRLAQDASLSDAQRAAFRDTANVDVEFRKLRAQAARLSQVAQAIAGPAPLAKALPKISVYTCNHTQSLPGVHIASPAKSADTTVKHVYAETTSLATFYKKVFGRNSVDGAGMTLVSSTHYGNKYNNAFWNGSQMTYGDGDGQIFVDFSRGNDVIGHELTHGVTQHSLQLGYADEPGGLNESISDCFGSMFRQWEANQTVDKADWLIGKDIMGPKSLAKNLTCLRDMADPAASHCLAPQPAKYAQITPGMDPHYSSGPPNLAFCTACKAAGGNSWERVGQVWYKAVTGFGPSPDMKMKDFADRTRAVVAQLFPGDAAMGAPVDAGWKQVGL